MTTDQIEQALGLIHEFKRRWMALPPFAERLTRDTREGMTVAHMPVMELEQLLLDAKASKPCGPEDAIAAWNRNAGVPVARAETIPGQPLPNPSADSATAKE
jgi:hypothetical protein